jgi:putative intracellular protease/amidase
MSGEWGVLASRSSLPRRPRRSSLVGPHKADTLWMDQAAVAFVWDFIASGRPVEVICHGPSTLVKADVVRGRTVTSYPSVATDLRHSRASWIDQEVIAHGNLIGSRNPDELPTFLHRGGSPTQGGTLLSR